MKKHKTIIFITGAFISHTIWDPWLTFFNEKGYNAIAPAWPYKNAPATELKETLTQNAEFAALRLTDIIQYYTNIVNAQDEKPIVIGHALGGLIAQILVNNNLVKAGVAIHSVPPKGVFSFEWSFLKSIWKPLGLLPFGKKVFMMNRSDWDYAFTNGMSETEQAQSFERFCLPESRQILKDGLSDMARVDFVKQHPPLLFITGSNDRITPNSLNYENYARYSKDHSITDYKEFADRNHFVLALPTWKEEAEYILDWIDIHQLH